VLHPSSTQRLSRLGVPVAVGVDQGPDEAGGDQAGHSPNELVLGQDGVVVSLGDDLDEGVAVLGPVPSMEAKTQASDPGDCLVDS